MKKKKIMNRFIVVSAILFLGAMNISAQVTIGKLAAPHAAAVLDLSQVESHNLGLLPPRVKLTALNIFSPLTGNEEKAAGMCVYNTVRYANSFCPGLYVWNGAEWNRLGEPCQILPIADPVVSSCTSNIIVPPVHFMSYNLGADPTYDTPKKQMAYKPTDATDAHVYGGLYQWGRKDLTHGASTDGTYKRYNGGSSGNNAAAGPTNDPKDGIFYYRDADDWRSTSDDALWGNGKGLAADGTIDKGGVKFTDNNYYQNTDWVHPENNPCPPGWRVPTQDEIERFTAYDCRPDEIDSYIDVSALVYFDAIPTTGGTGNETSLYTLVKVKNGKANSTTLSWNSGETTPGLAVYLKSEWEIAVGIGGYLEGLQNNGSGMPADKYLYDSSAPEPVLFLPAAGHRIYSNGNFNCVGQFCDYWSSMPLHLHFYNNNTVSPSFDSSRAYGFSIRCCTTE